jgi:hypothetical protein
MSYERIDFVLIAPSLTRIGFIFHSVCFQLSSLLSVQDLIDWNDPIENETNLITDWIDGMKPIRGRLEASLTMMRIIIIPEPTARNAVPGVSPGRGY